MTEKKKRDTSKARAAAALVPRKPYRGNRTGQRLAQVRALMARGLPTGRVVDILSAEFKCSRRTVDGYVMAVRQETLRDFQRSSADGSLRADLLNRMDAIYQDAMKNKNHNAAIRANALISDWAGLSQPQRVEISGPGGAPIETQGSVELKGLPDELFRALGGMIGEKDTEE